MATLYEYAKAHNLTSAQVAAMTFAEVLAAVGISPDAIPGDFFWEPTRNATVSALKADEVAAWKTDLETWFRSKYPNVEYVDDGVHVTASLASMGCPR